MEGGGHHERRPSCAQRVPFSRCIDVIPKKPNNRNGKEPKDERDFFCKVRDSFRVFAHRTSEILGSAWSFVVALAIIIVWGFTGHLFHYSDTWQLIINTGTTIVTFLMVFLIQNTQNRDSKSIQLKLDELIRAVSGARNQLMDLEKLSDDDLKKFQKEFERLSKRAESASSKLDEVSEKVSR
jgi:low affinity Fe/Cu permease